MKSKHEEKEKHEKKTAPEETKAAADGKEPAEKKVEIPEADYAALCAKVSELEGIRDKCLRTAADYENAKKRLAKEREDYLRFANESLISGLLPAIDNLDRALDHTEALAEESAKALRDGVSLVKKQLLDFLKTKGLERIEAVGKKFDPHFHEAIGHIESGDHPDETVLEELEAGYLLNDKLLRPAKVRISQAKSGRAEAVSGSETAGPGAENEEQRPAEQ
ncbi:MAG TPA: nucleotide exchange factor GrpE [Candidatus Omnitrophota bacterium]|nr:nucleotide exchange factor GrpE [Candidatus Omnitrophota bacterium]